MKSHKKKKIKISKFEKCLYALAIIMVSLCPLMTVFEKSTLSEVNYEVEKIKTKIAEQKKANESLEMKINELASLENIQKVIEDEGLVYNNDNIKNID